MIILEKYNVLRGEAPSKKGLTLMKKEHNNKEDIREDTRDSRVNLILTAMFLITALILLVGTSIGGNVIQAFAVGFASMGGWSLLLVILLTLFGGLLAGRLWVQYETYKMEHMYNPR